MSNTDLSASEVVSGAGPSGRGRSKAGVHKVQPDPANVGVCLVQGVLARVRRVVGVWETFNNKIELMVVIILTKSIYSNSTTYICTRVHDVGEIELEVVAGAVADIDGAAGAEARGACAEDGAASGVTL